MIRMIRSTANSCEMEHTTTDKIWNYEQYYIGERDEEKRKNGRGEHHWTGAQSLESYTGVLFRDTMHGMGDYRWRHSGPESLFVTYEGHFFNNRLHGYGTMSYPNGRIFKGLFHDDIRWGPGVESFPFLQENVGLWCGTQLVRIAWRPAAPSVTPDFLATPVGKTCVIPHRVLLKRVTKTIGEINSALELLKKYEAKPVPATEKWSRLYPTHCTDLKSELCHHDAFNHDYYKGKIHTLEEIISLSGNKPEETHQQDCSETDDIDTYYAWNNNEIMIHMMKHCFKHDGQRKDSRPRSDYKPAAKQELDCRTLLMASYLGHITNVAQLINERGVNPNIADIQGNSAVMYATSGERADNIHFLVEAGADVNSYNDACCTPLGVALVRFACAQKDIPPNVIVQTILPKDGPLLEQDSVSEWKFSRDMLDLLQRTPSKIGKTIIARAPSAKKIKSSMSIKDLSKKKPEIRSQKSADLIENDSNQTFSEENRLYVNILNEYIIRVNDAFILPNPTSPLPYLFEVNEMVKAASATDEEPKKQQDKISKRVPSKVIKDTIKPSKDKMWQNGEKEITSISSAEKAKLEMLARLMATVMQLLKDGADPRLVQFPQPALFIATVSGSSELVRLLIKYGADINETYPQAFHYSALDVALSAPFTIENLDLIQTLLQGGASADRRLTVIAENDADSADTPAIPGPTLLHAVLARKIENECEDEIRQQVLELLLQYGSNPTAQYKGRSAIDIAMSKSMEVFDVFVRAPHTDLNEIINMSNQTILVKMFSTVYCKTIPNAERLQMLTNLLSYGADPLLQCQNGEEVYQNLFVYAKKEMENIPTKPSATTGGGKVDAKGKKAPEKAPEKPKKDEKPSISTKSMARMAIDDKGDYKQALDLVTECARLLHIRWLQAKLMKELIEVVYKYKHRAWVMILKEIKNKKRIGLWLTAVRCLEIWDILKTTKNKKYNDETVLKHVLCIVHYYFRNTKRILRNPQKHLKARDMEVIHSEVDYFVREHNVITYMSSDMIPLWKRPYVKPELTSKGAKFNVCFECALPLNESRLLCSSCKLVSFCSLDCMEANIPLVNCHPCSGYLQKKHFPFQEDAGTLDF